MNRLLLTATAAACTLLAGFSTASAQDQGPPQFNPVEMWVCNYNDRKNQDDFDDVIEMLADVEEGQPYSAFQVVPWYTNPTFDFDFIYLGAWPSGSAMGQDLNNYLTNGSEASEAWEEAVTCDTSVIYGSYAVEPVPEDADGEFILSIADCTVAHGSSNGHAIGAMERYNDWAKANGSTLTTLAWFPVFGNGATEFTFKRVQAYNDATHLGDTWQWSIDNQSYNVSADMTQGIVDCDAPRLYLGRTLIGMNADD